MNSKNHRRDTRRMAVIALGAMAAFSPLATRAQPAEQAPTPAPAASAASAPDVTTLPAVRVKATAAKETATGPVQGYSTRRSATATRIDTPLNEVPQSVSVIGAEQVRDQNSLTLQEALRYTVGVNSEMYGLDNRGDYFALRGIEASTLLDGLRLPITGYWGSVRNEPYAFERIEVLRGPASLLAGQNAPGGVVNMVSKRPLSTPSREVQVQLGNNQHKQIGVDLTGPVLDDGRLDYRLVATGKDSGSQVDIVEHERTLLAPSLSWTPLAGTKLTVYAEYQKDKSQNENGFFPVAGVLNEAPNGRRIDPSVFVGDPGWDTYGGTRNRFGWELEQKLASDWTVRQRTRHDKVKAHLATAYADWSQYVNSSGTVDANPANNVYLNRFAYVADDTSSIANADLMLEGKLTLGPTRHTLVTGADYMSHRSVHTDFGGFAMTPLNPFDPVYTSTPLPPLSVSYVADTRVRNVGVLLQDQIKIGTRWSVLTGLRHDRAKTDDLVTPDNGTSDKATSKNLGVVYLGDDGWSPYTGYSESFQPVAGATSPARGGVPFKPSRGKQLEAGLKWMPEKSNVNATAAIFRLKETNRLATDPNDVNYSIQVGEATIDGLELDVNATLPAWQFLANYTYLRARLTGEFDANPGEQLEGIRKHAATAWAIHRFGALELPGLRAGGGLRYIGPAWDGTGNTRVPSVTLLDAMVSYETGPWSLAFNVNNLTDKTYVATCLGRGDCWFGTKRRAVLTAAYRW